MAASGGGSQAGSEPISKQAFQDMFGAAVGNLVKSGKELNALYKEVTPSARARQERRRARAIRRNGGKIPANSRAELLATRKWERSKEALDAAKLQWFQGGGKPCPKKVDPDPTRTHLLPKKFRNPAKTRSELVARRMKEDHKLAEAQAPTKERSIHPANLPKMVDGLGDTVGWWQENRHNLFRTVDRGAGTTTWGRDDGLDKLNQTVVDGGFNHAEAPEEARRARSNRRKANSSWVEFPMSQVVKMPLLDDDGNVLQRPKGGTPRLPTPHRHRRRVKVQDGMIREPPAMVDPLRKRAIKREELERRTQLLLGVSQKVTRARPPSRRALQHSRRAHSHTFTDSVLAFGPMVKTPDRFPVDKSLDEFGKSQVVLAEELAPVPSCFSKTSESYRLTRSFGPGPGAPKGPVTHEDDEELEPGLVFGTSIELPPRTAPAGGAARRSPRVVEFSQELSERPSLFSPVDDGGGSGGVAFGANNHNASFSGFDFPKNGGEAETEGRRHPVPRLGGSVSAPALRGNNGTRGRLNGSASPWRNVASAGSAPTAAAVNQRVQQRRRARERAQTAGPGRMRGLAGIGIESQEAFGARPYGQRQRAHTPQLRSSAKATRPRRVYALPARNRPPKVFAATAKYSSARTTGVRTGGGLAVW